MDIVLLQNKNQFLLEEFLMFRFKRMMTTVFACAAGILFVSSTAQAAEIYEVKSGDTLSSIAVQKLGSAAKMDQIIEKNHIENPNLIYPGQKLELPDGENPQVAQPVNNEVPTDSTVASNQESQETQVPTGTQLTVEATAYDGYGMGGMTATGNMITSPSDKVIAVDPNVIPLGSRVYVPGYGEAIAWDTGGVIKGNIIDLNMSESDAVQWGRRMVTITILN